MSLIERIEVLFSQDRVGSSRFSGSSWFNHDGGASLLDEVEKERRRRFDLRQRKAFRRALTEPFKRGIVVFGQPIEEL